MKKIQNKICGVFFIILTAGLAACNGEQGGTGGNLNQPVNQPKQHTLQELSETIVAAGEFWEDWWWRSGVFAWEHIDDSRRNCQPWYEEIAPAHHPLSRGFSVLLPSSGFTSLNDIGVYLLQFYTHMYCSLIGRSASCSLLKAPCFAAAFGVG